MDGISGELSWKEANEVSSYHDTRHRKVIWAVWPVISLLQSLVFLSTDGSSGPGQGLLLPPACLEITTLHTLSGNHFSPSSLHVVLLGLTPSSPVLLGVDPWPGPAMKYYISLATVV